MTNHTRAILEQDVRHGLGVGHGGGPNGIQLASQLGTAGLTPDLMTMMGTIRELQDALRHERVEFEERLGDMERLLAERLADPHALRDAERALFHLVRGVCPSQSSIEAYWSDRVRTHRGAPAGYQVRHLASELGLGRATFTEALLAIKELCDTIDCLQHRTENLDDGWQDDADDGSDEDVE